MVVLAKLQPGNYTCVVPTHPALPHGSAAYLTPCVCITAPEQSCLLAQFPQGNPPKLAQSCRASAHPCPLWLSESKALLPLRALPGGTAGQTPALTGNQIEAFLVIHVRLHLAGQ